MSRAEDIHGFLIIPCCLRHADGLVMRSDEEEHPACSAAGDGACWLLPAHPACPSPQLAAERLVLVPRQPQSRPAEQTALFSELPLGKNNQKIGKVLTVQIALSASQPVTELSSGAHLVQ